jgi:hypothetical protein
MAKSGSSRMLQGPSRPATRPSPIRRFTPPAAPLVRPMSPGAPKIAANLKPEEKHPSGSIDPRQMRY